MDKNQPLKLIFSQNTNVPTNKSSVANRSTPFARARRCLAPALRSLVPEHQTDGMINSARAGTGAKVRKGLT